MSDNLTEEDVERMICIKIKFPYDVRRFSITEDCTFKLFIFKVVRILQHQHKHFSLRYRDVEGDLCTLTCEEEFQEAKKSIDNVMRILFEEDCPESQSILPLYEECAAELAKQVESIQTSVSQEPLELEGSEAERDPERFRSLGEQEARLLAKLQAATTQAAEAAKALAQSKASLNKVSAELAQSERELQNAIKRREAAEQAEKLAAQRIEQLKNDLVEAEAAVPNAEQTLESKEDMRETFEREYDAHLEYMYESGFMRREDASTKESENSQQGSSSSSSGNSGSEKQLRTVRAPLGRQQTDVSETAQRAEVEKIKAMMKLMRRDLSKVEKANVVYTGYRDNWVEVKEEKKDNAEDVELTKEETERLTKVYYQQLNDLNNLGFKDQDLNLKFLVECNGDAEAVLAKLLDNEWRVDHEDEEFLVL